MGGRPLKYPRAQAKILAIKHALLDAHLTQAELAKKAKRPRSSVQAALRGQQCPIATAQRIAKVLGKDVAELFTVIEKPEAPTTSSSSQAGA